MILRKSIEFSCNHTDSRYPLYCPHSAPHSDPGVDPPVVAGFYCEECGAMDMYEPWCFCQPLKSKAPKRRVWFWRARRLSGPWLGVPGCRPPVWFGADEFDRRTLVLQLPGVGCMIIALWRCPEALEGEG